MRSLYVVPAVAVTLIAAPSVLAQKPVKPPKPTTPASITLDAASTPIVFSGNASLSGRMASTGAGVVVRLDQDTTAPYGDAYRSTGQTAATAANGGYGFTVKPLVNTQYRVTAQASPPVTSAPKLVLVRPLVGIKISDSTPRRGALVRFSGSIFPAHDGATALIQKRGSTGRFVTVARTTLRDAGTARSSYNRRVRVYRDGVYRVKVAGHADHVNGFSRLRSVNVG